MIDPPRILVVEDDPSIAEFIMIALEDEGYSVASAMDGVSALDVLAQESPALILLDMRMPIMDGPKFATAYRQLPPPHAPIIVLTAARDASETAASIAADGVLAKPFNLQELILLVRRFLEP